MGECVHAPWLKCADVHPSCTHSPTDLDRALSPLHAGAVIFHTCTDSFHVKRTAGAWEGWGDEVPHSVNLAGCVVV